jgi:hypothetical protein
VFLNQKKTKTKQTKKQIANTRPKAEIWCPVISKFIPKEKERKMNVSSVPKSKKNKNKQKKQIANTHLKAEIWNPSLSLKKKKGKGTLVAFPNQKKKK